MAFSGDAVIGRAMCEWYESGADPAKYPEHQKDENKACGFVVIDRAGIKKYEHTTSPYWIEDEVFVMGSGRDYARAAMHLGKTATEAVAIACLFDPGCGNGIDTLTL